MGSLAAETRAAVDAHPFVHDALRAGILNYAAAARYLDVDGEEEAIATALRRYEAELPELAGPESDIRVRMASDVGSDILVVDGETPAAIDDPVTAITVAGAVDAAFLATALSRLGVADVTVEGAGFADDVGIVLVPRRQGARALQVIEDTAAIS